MRNVRRRFGFWFTNTLVPVVYPPINPFITRVIESRLHWLVSWYVAVVRFEGRRSGRTYSVPFTYDRLDPQTFECTTNRRAVWWRNLIGGVPASLLYKGRWYEADAIAIEDEPAIVEALARRDRARAFLVDVPVEESVLVRVTLR